MSLVIASDPVPLAKDRHGVVRVAGTRVTLETIVAAYQQGGTPETIAQQYPAVSLADVYAVIAYYLRRKAEVNAYVEEQRRRGDAVRAEHESRFPQAGLRDKLLARRESQDER